jgi:hypothetical protein
MASFLDVLSPEAQRARDEAAQKQPLAACPRREAESTFSGFALTARREIDGRDTLVRVGTPEN